MTNQSRINNFLLQSTDIPDLTYIEIKSHALNHNIKQYKSLLPSNEILAPVIKSNAYGHGILEIGTLLEKNTLVDYICVVSLSEAMQLRSGQITKPILVLSILDMPLEYAIAHNIDIVIYEKITVKRLASLAKEMNKKAHIHIKIDTGLSRLGVSHTDAFEFIHFCKNFMHINIVGIFSHYIDAENTYPKHCVIQQKRFDALLQDFKWITYKHFSCSAALLHLDSTYNFCRFGIGLYGLWPSQEVKTITQKKHPSLTLQPVLTWKTHIIAIKVLPKNSAVGYNATYTTQRATRTAVLPIGYWDGYDRKLSNKTVVKIKNQYAPVLGCIAMNMTVVDITNIPHINVGECVTLLGKEKNISAETLAQKSETINYEFVTRINPLIKRKII